MKKEYQKHIVSTEEHQVWLHRTHNTNIESILKNGLSYGGGDLSSTASLQSEQLERAEQSYRMAHKGSNAVVIIKIPREISKKYYFPNPEEKGIGHAGYDSDKQITYFGEKGFTIQRQHIHGWIDKETDEYHPNPYLKEPQNLTNKHFPPEAYGGLEKDLIQEPKPIPETKKQKKLKKGELPLPPEQIVIP